MWKGLNCRTNPRSHTKKIDFATFKNLYTKVRMINWKKYNLHLEGLFFLQILMLIRNQKQQRNGHRQGQVTEKKAKALKHMRQCLSSLKWKRNTSRRDHFPFISLETMKIGYLTDCWVFWKTAFTCTGGQYGRGFYRGTFSKIIKMTVLTWPLAEQFF